MIAVAHVHVVAALLGGHHRPPEGLGDEPLHGRHAGVVGADERGSRRGQGAGQRVEGLEQPLGGFVPLGGGDDDDAGRRRWPLAVVVPRAGGGISV